MTNAILFTSKMSFQDKVVIVTGASSGIGAATAKMFAKEKAKVVIVGRNMVKLSKVDEEIKKTTSTIPLLIKADISQDEEAIDIIAKTIAHFKKIDVLVNNAGFSVPVPLLSDNYIKEFDRAIATNLRGIAVLINAAAPHLIKTKGNIVNISSNAAVTSNLPYYSSYATSKAGVDHLSRCLAVELSEHGVRVNTVNPGPVATDIAINNSSITREQAEAGFKYFAKLTPLQRICEAEEIGDVILFLASDKAKSVTGSSYFIDCGTTVDSSMNNNLKMK